MGYSNASDPMAMIEANRNESKNERTQIEDCKPESLSVPSSPKKKENGKLNQRSRDAPSSLLSLTFSLFREVPKRKESHLDFDSLEEKKGRFRKSCSKGKT